MINTLRKIKGSYTKSVRAAQRKKIDAFVSAYIQKNGLTDLLNKVNEASNSSGGETHDYIALHSYVRKHKVKYILECGTGKSTWILAHALQKNHQEFGIEGKVISMESLKEWYEEAERIVPEELKPFVELHHSPAATYMYSIIKGTAFTQVPDYPYGLVFVDGPELTITENGNAYETANMDFIRYVQSSDEPVTAIVDSRLRSCIAYGLIFGKEKVKFLKPWLLGIVENVTRKDMLLNVDGEPLSKILKQTTSVKFDEPSWLKNEI